MKESVAIAKEADTMSSPTKSDKRIHRVRNEPERQLGSLRDVVGNIRRNGGTPSSESIATELSGMHAVQRAPALLALQQTHGNQYVQRVVSMIQAKLVVGQPRDVYEQEADRVADEVMRMPEPRVQLQAEEADVLIQTKPLAEQISPLLQRQVDEVEEESVQAKARDKNPYVGQSLQKQLTQSRDEGSSLPEQSSAFMESRFGTDFRDARVHTDSQATEMAKTLNAQAFTSGRDIYFGAGRYAPGTTSGDRLLAHELTHVIQQRSLPGIQGFPTSISRLSTENSEIIYRQPADATETEAVTPSKPAADIALGVMELKGKPTFEPEGATAEYFESVNSGKVNVRFGKMAEGTITVTKKSSGRYNVKKQSISLNHPIFSRIGEGAAGFKPGLMLYTNKEGQIRGYIGVGEKGGSKAFDSPIRKAPDPPDLIGLAGFDLGKSATIINKIEAGNLRFGLKVDPVTLGGVFSGKITLEAINEDITFAGNANIKARGLVSGDLELNRSKEGLITGKAEVGLQLPKNFSGNLIVIWDGQVVTGEGKVGYEGEKFSGAIILKLMEKSQAEQLEEGAKAPADKVAAPGTKKSKKGKADYVVFGEGDLTFAFTEWLAGTAHVIVSPKGHITVIGKIEPQKEIELFSQKDYNKKLFKLEARASYGIPVVGNIFIFANVGMDAFANIGPGKLYNMSVEGTYSTDPKKKQDFTIQGSLNISAGAGLRLRGEAGAGLEVLDHDIKAGAGINGLAGIRGYAEATPVIGYREKAKEGEDKKGEFFIRGDLEIAAQPFLGLSGDLFVEIDAPWWSPVPDKRWTWPLGNKEWPIGGSLGMNASVDYVFGSKEPPAVEIKPAEFSADKFLTDLYSDKAKAKSGGAEKKKGTWAEKNSKGAEPPKGGNKGGAQVGEAPKLPPAQPKVKPGGAKKVKKPVDPNAMTAEGKSVKEYQEEASKKEKKPEAKGPIKGTGKEAAVEKGKEREKEDRRKDALAVRQTVKDALKTQLPNGAKEIADVNKVLAGVANKVKPALTNLRAEEAMIGKPKKEGVIGFKVKARAEKAGDVLIDAVRYSKEGAAISPEERWGIGVDGVKKAVNKLRKKGISEKTIKAQFPIWESEFGFKPKSLILNITERGWVLEGEMSPGKAITQGEENLQATEGGIRDRFKIEFAKMDGLAAEYSLNKLREADEKTQKADNWKPVRRWLLEEGWIFKRPLSPKTKFGKRQTRLHANPAAEQAVSEVVRKEGISTTDVSENAPEKIVNKSQPKVDSGRKPYEISKIVLQEYAFDTRISPVLTLKNAYIESPELANVLGFGPRERHHLITKRIKQVLIDYKSPIEAQKLRDDPRMLYLSSPAGHIGYERWHRAYDDDVEMFIRRFPEGTLEFDDLIKKIHNYYQPRKEDDVSKKIPDVNLLNLLGSTEFIIKE